MNIPEGWPTKEMLDAAEEVDVHPYRDTKSYQQLVFEAMLAAASTPPANTIPLETVIAEFESDPEMKEAMDAARRPPATEVEPVAWRVDYVIEGMRRRGIFGHNPIADYLDIDPDATATPLYTRPINDGLRKAAKELICYMDSRPEGPHYPGAYLPLIENLRAELDKP